MIPHSRPTLGEAEESAVLNVLRSGQLAAGPQTRAFEEAFAKVIGMPHAVAVSSGTAGLHLALLALGVGNGDEVIMPSYVCSALLNAVCYVGAHPILADSLPGHPHMDHRAAIKKIGKKTKAVITVSLFGDADDASLWKDTGLPMIEDGTQSLGAYGVSGAVGSQGTLSVFSLYATKMITMGEGGVITARDAAVAERLKDLREYDQKDDAVTRFNYKCTDMAAGLGMAQLHRLNDFIGSRRALAGHYDKALAKGSWGGSVQDKHSVYYRYVLRSQLAPALLETMERAGVQCKRPVHNPLHRMLGLQDTQFPNASRHQDQNVSVPLYPSLRLEEMQTVCDALRRSEHVEV